MVHQDHGIGRYEGLISIPVGNSPHDCVALTYSGGDKLYVPVENIDVLSRYGSDSEHVSLDKLGGEAWQRRKSKLKERIRAIAGELLKTEAKINMTHVPYKGAAAAATRNGLPAGSDQTDPWLRPPDARCRWHSGRARARAAG